MDTTKYDFSNRKIYFLFKYQIIAGKFNRSSWLLQDQTKKMASINNPHVQFFTEVSDRHRWDSIFIDRYITLHSEDNKGASECAINVREDYDVLFWESKVLTDHRFYSMRGRKRAFVNSLTAVIQDKAKLRKPVVISVVHLPPNVEGSKGFSDTVNRVIAWRQAVIVWRRYIRQIRKKYKTGNVLCVADFNMNLKKLWVRRQLKSVFRLYRFIFRHPYPKGGDLGNRLITYGLYRGFRWHKQAEILPKHKASDHNPIIGILNQVK